MTMSINMQIRMVCRKCGSDNVHLTTYCAWDMQRQQWTAVDGVSGPVHCHSCNAETDYIDLHEEGVRLVDCDGRPFVPSRINVKVTQHFKVWRTIVLPVEADSFEAAVAVLEDDGVAAFDDPRWQTEWQLTDQEEEEVT
jgi:hypothetical protein